MSGEAAKVVATIAAKDEASAVFDKVAKKSGATAEQIENRWKLANRIILGAIAGAGAIVAKSTLDFIKYGDEIAKLSARTGIGAETLSAYGYAASLADASTQDLATALRVLSKNLVDANAGAANSQDAFTALNLNWSAFETTGAGLEQLLGVIADRFAGMEDGAAKTAAAVGLLGRGGTQLIPLLNSGSSGLKEARAEAEKLGLVLSSSTAKEAERTADAITRLEKSVEGLKIQLGRAVVESGLVDYARWLIGLATDGIGLTHDAVDALNRETDALLKERVAAREGFKTAADFAEFRKMIAEFDPDSEMARRLASGASGFYQEKARRAAEDAQEAAAAQAAWNAQLDEFGSTLGDAYRELDAFIKAAYSTSGLGLKSDFGGGIRQGIRETRDELADFYEQARAMTRGFLQDTNRDWSSLFFDVMERRISGLDNIVAHFANAVVQSLERIAAQQAANALTSALLGSLGGIFGGGGFSPGPTPLGPPSSLAAPPNRAVEGVGPIALPDEARAGGGPVQAGRRYLVGERGPETFVPGRSGTVIPDGGGRGGANHVTINVHAIDARSFAQLVAENAHAFAAAVVKVASSDPSSRNALKGALS